MRQFTSDIIYNGTKSLFSDNVKQNDPFNHVLCVIHGAIETLFKNNLLDCIDIKQLGFDCIPEGTTKQCLVMDWITSNILNHSLSINTLIQNVQILQSGINLLGDEKVKVRAAGNAAFLEQIIDAPSSAVEFQDNKISFYGFVPVGTRATVNANRSGDFDATGKGKPGTDLWGWAIRNGNNGLANALGTFGMYTDNLLNADTSGGNDSFTVSKDNISSFSIPVTGIITEALENGVKFKVGWRHYRSFDGKEGNDKPIKDSQGNSGDIPWYTDPYNFKHTHGFNLAVAHNKPNPVSIPLIPKHIKEIPIERIIP